MQDLYGVIIKMMISTLAFVTRAGHFYHGYGHYTNIDLASDDEKYLINLF